MDFTPKINHNSRLHKIAYVKRRVFIKLSFRKPKSLKFASGKHVDHVIETKKYCFSIYTHKLRRK